MLQSKLQFMLSENGSGGSKFIVNQNGEISFTCYFDPDLLSDIELRKPLGEQIALNKNTTILRHTVRNVSCDDAGEYMCSARPMLTLQEAISKLPLIVKCKINLDYEYTFN